MGATRIGNSGASAKGSSAFLGYSADVISRKIAVQSPYNFITFLPIDLGCYNGK